MFQVRIYLNKRISTEPISILYFILMYPSLGRMCRSPGGRSQRATGDCHASATSRHWTSESARRIPCHSAGWLPATSVRSVRGTTNRTRPVPEEKRATSSNVRRGRETYRAGTRLRPTDSTATSPRPMHSAAMASRSSLRPSSIW